MVDRQTISQRYLPHCENGRSWGLDPLIERGVPARATHRAPIFYLASRTPSTLTAENGALEKPMSCWRNLAESVGKCCRSLLCALCPSEKSTPTPSQLNRDHRVSRSGTFPPISGVAELNDRASCTGQYLSRVFQHPRREFADSSLEAIQRRLVRVQESIQRSSPRPFGAATSQLSAVRDQMRDCKPPSPPIDWSLAGGDTAGSVVVELADLITGLPVDSQVQSPFGSLTSRGLSEVEGLLLPIAAGAQGADLQSEISQGEIYPTTSGDRRWGELIESTVDQLEAVLGESATLGFLQKTDRQLFVAFVCAQAKFNCQLRLTDDELALVAYMQEQINEVLRQS